MDPTFLLALAVVPAALLVLAAVGFRLAERRRRQLRDLLGLLIRLAPDQLKQPAPTFANRDIRSAVAHLWEVVQTFTNRERELLAQNHDLQRRFGQSRALIDLMSEFNRVMQLNAVLDRLSTGLSRFFAGDGVAIWVRAPQGHLQLAVKVAEDFPSTLAGTDRWVETVLAGEAGLALPIWLDKEMPCLASPLLDAQGQRIGVVAITSRRRDSYSNEDGAFLRTVIGHAAMAIQNATMYEFIDTLSRIDALTGLHNRREFDRLLAQEIARARQSGQRLSLIEIDIDHFKQINDQYGHQEGDLALQQVARLIQLVPKRVSDAAFRTGGEEFAVLMGDTEKSGALALSESLRSITEKARFFKNERVTVSLGVATFPDDASDASSLVAAADRALYQAKAGGRNRVEAA